MMADISHWFVKRRGFAVVVVASGNYLAGAIWPLAMNGAMPLIGWRGTYIAIGLFVAATVLPFAASCAAGLRRMIARGGGGDEGGARTSAFRRAS